MTSGRWTLEDVCEKKSSNLMQKDLRLGAGEFPVYGASGLLGYVDFFQRNEEYVAVVKDGAGVGRAMMLPAKSSCIGTMQYLIPKEGVLSHFLYYAIESMNLAKYNTGATIPHIYFRDYKKETLPRVDLSEQGKIVAVLDKVTETIKKRRDHLNFFDDLVKSQFIEMFGSIDESRFVPLSKVGKISTGSTPSMRIPEYYEKKEVPFIKPSDIELEVSRIYRGESAVDNRAKPVCRLFGRGTVLVTCIGTIGKIGISEIEGTCNQQINFIEPYETIDPTFLAYAIESRKTQLIEMANAPVVPIINKSLFSTFRIPLANAEAQKQFAHFVEQTDKSKVLLAIKLFFHLYTAICLKAFEKSTQMMYNHI